MELNARFKVMTINEVTLDRPEVFPGFSVIFCFCRLETLPVRPEVLHWDLRSLQLFPHYNGFSEIVGSSWQFCCTICYWEYFCCIDYLRIDFWRVHVQLLNVWDRNISFPHSPHDELHIQGMFQIKLSHKIAGALTGLVSKSDDIQPLRQKAITGPLNGSPNHLSHRVFHLLGGLEHFACSNSIPYHQPTIFHPSLIATVQQTSLLLFCVPLFWQYHSSRIDEVSKFGDSMIIFHRICQIPMNCQCIWLSAFPTARETFVNSFPSPEKFLLCTDKIESIE